MVHSDVPATIPGILVSRAASAPDAEALKAPGRSSLTAAQLLHLTTAIASSLRETGVSRTDRVAIVLSNGPEMAATFLGVSAAAVAAPLNPAYRAAEFEFYFEDLHPRAVILPRDAEAPARRVADALRIPIIEMQPLVDEGAGALSLGGSFAASPCVVDLPGSSDLALVLHTSGTTARPKMVPLTHAALCESARNIARAFELGKSDRCLNIMPLFHVHGLVAALLSSLASGGSLVCAPGFLSTRFFEWMSETRPTWYTAVPTMHRSIAARASSHPEAVRGHSLRFIRSSSSALPLALMRDLEAIFGVPVLEAYGMTEAAHQIAANPMPPRPRKPGSVGIVTGPDLAVLDETGAELARNRTGEIVLRGPTVITRYLATAEVNERSFVRGWFRTGDSGYVDEDGYVFITGRIKEVINRGGQKISPREVEQVLLAHPSVAEAIVFAVPDPRLGEEVGAAIVPKQGARVDESLIRTFAATHVADFKVPRIIRIVDEFPLGPTGKVQRIGMADRLGIVALDERLTSRTAHVAPRTPLEHQLAEVWREVLEIGHDGIDDDFFLVGGDSILATTLLVKVTEKLGTYVSLVDFMEAPTIRGLAAAVERQRYSGAPGGAAGLVAIQPDGAEVPLFCVPPLDGSLVGFGLLSSHLGRDRPMWGFGQPASRADDAPNTIEDIAAAYVATMRAMRPGGPYLLLGDCFGGFVAYEMACQLGRGGEEPAFLGMVDTPYRRGWRQNTSLPTALAVRAKHGLVRARYQFSVLTQLSGNERLQYLRERVAGLVSRIRDRYWGLVRRTFLRLELTPPVAARDPRYANEWAEARYEPDAFRGRVTFFKTTDPSPGFYLPDLQGWENLFLGESRLIQLPGEHRFRYRKETLEVLARALQVEMVRQSREPDARVGPLLTERPHRGNDVARKRWKLPPRVASEAARGENTARVAVRDLARRQASTCVPASSHRAARSTTRSCVANRSRS